MHIKHNMSYKHPLYTLWKSARNRCNNPNSLDYPRYGGRGIKMSKSWDDYSVYYKDNIDEYNRMKKIFPNERLTTERINNNRGYVKGNVTFIPNRLQSKTRNYCWTFETKDKDGNIYTVCNLKEFCRDNNLSYDNVKYHISHKKSFIYNGVVFENTRRKG